MSTAAQPTSARAHRMLVPALLTLATVIGFFACFAVWINRQVFNTKHWTTTTTKVLADARVQEALGAYLVNELFTQVDVQARLQSALPAQLRPLSGPLAGGLRTVAEREAPRLLATERVQNAWRRVNLVAHTQLLRVLEGGGRTVSTREGKVTVNVRELITELGKQLGVSSQLEAARSKLSGAGGAGARTAAEQKLGIALPASAGSIVILRSNQLRAAQAIANGIHDLALLFTVLAFGLFALAVWLARGRRRTTLRTAGWCMFGIGVAVLLLRRIGGEQLVDALVRVEANKPAAEAVWSIGTSLLYNIAVAMVFYGLVLVVAAWIGGMTRPAVHLRRIAAPWLQRHPGGSYAAAGALVLLLILWAPTEASRQWLPILIFAMLAALGVTALRRLTMREYPGALAGAPQASAGAIGGHGDDGGIAHSGEPGAAQRKPGEDAAHEGPRTPSGSRPGAT